VEQFQRVERVSGPAGSELVMERAPRCSQPMQYGEGFFGTSSERVCRKTTSS
jgi:hypothetical protein